MVLQLENSNISTEQLRAERMQCTGTYVHHMVFPRVQATRADDGAVEPAMDAGARDAQEHSSVEAAPLRV